MNLPNSATGPRRFRFALFLLSVAAVCLASSAQTKPPSRLPDFQFKLTDGKVVKSSDLGGKVVIVEFWGTWCKPCLAEIPDFNSFYDQYKGKGVLLLALAVDSGPEDRVREAAKRLGIQYPVAAPALSDLDVFGDISVVPTTWIVDRTGKVRKVLYGSAPEKVEAVREIVDRLLKD